MFLACPPSEHEFVPEFVNVRISGALGDKDE